MRSFTAKPSAALSYGPLATEDGRALVVERARPVGAALVVKFRGIDDRDAAAALNGQTLSVPRAALPATEADEFYQADLIGLVARALAGEPIGTVAAVVNHGAGDILDIATPQGSLLVPFTHDAVPEIDIAAGWVVVVPPVPAEDDEDEEPPT
jgi:16S rRNA processing protein RimM